MSEYKRNKAMIVCILAVVVGGAALSGWLAYTGGWMGFGWGNSPTTTFQFMLQEDNPPSSAVVIVQLDVGTVNVTFTDSPDLVYLFEVEVPNATLQTQGVPTIQSDNGVYILNYTVATVNLVLGNSSRYVIGAEVDTGDVAIDIGKSANVTEVFVTMTTGNVDLTISDDAPLQDRVDVSIRITTGNVNLTVRLPAGVGGWYLGSVDDEDITLEGSRWTRSGGFYITPDYDEAATKLKIVVTLQTGHVTALLG